MCVIYAFIYFLTLGAVAFILLGETSSLALRARTTALATATQAVLGISLQIAIPYMVNPDAGVSTHPYLPKNSLHFVNYRLT